MGGGKFCPDYANAVSYDLVYADQYGLHYQKFVAPEDGYITSSSRSAPKSGYVNINGTKVLLIKTEAYWNIATGSGGTTAVYNDQNYVIPVKKGDVIEDAVSNDSPWTITFYPLR